MKNRSRRTLQRFSPAERTGCIALTLAALLALVNPILATVPLTAFLILCLVAPFLPTASFFLPVISRGRSRSPAVALTFDDGPDPLTTPLLLEMLARHRARATFFVTGCKALRHPDLIRAILNQGHTIGNHSFRHDNLLLLRSCRILKQDITAAQQAYRRFGITPLAFRPPVGITNPRLKNVLLETGLYLVNFSNRAGEFGNRRIGHLSRRILSQLRPNDIILLHDVAPAKAKQYRRWQHEIHRTLTGIAARGLEIQPLEQLIDRPVMLRAGDRERQCGRET
jgi:peptidoglycan-N-acetylglucosamine deacetylase